MTLHGGEGDDWVRRLFHSADTSGDGNLSRSEFLLAVEQSSDQSLIGRSFGLPAGGVKGQYAREIFNMVFDCIDSDSSHLLSLLELQKFVRGVETFPYLYAEAVAAVERTDDPPPAWLDESTSEVIREHHTEHDGELTTLDTIQLFNKNPGLRRAVTAYHRARPKAPTAADLSLGGGGTNDAENTGAHFGDECTEPDSESPVFEESDETALAAGTREVDSPVSEQLDISADDVRTAAI